MIAATDAWLLERMSSWRSPGLDAAFLAVTWLGSLWVLLPMTFLAAAFFWATDRALALRLLALPIAAALVSNGLKHLFDRERPALYEAAQAVPGDPSMPSSHAAQVAAMALGIALLMPEGSRWPAAFLLAGVALMVGVSRLYLQVHWPSDVVAGWLIGLLCALAIVYARPT